MCAWAGARSERSSVAPTSFGADGARAERGEDPIERQEDAAFITNETVEQARQGVEH